MCNIICYGGSDGNTIIYPPRRDRQLAHNAKRAASAFVIWFSEENPKTDSSSFFVFRRLLLLFFILFICVCDEY